MGPSRTATKITISGVPGGLSVSECVGARGANTVSLWRRSRSGAARHSDSWSGATCGTGLTGCTVARVAPRFRPAADRQLVPRGDARSSGGRQTETPPNPAPHYNHHRSPPFLYASRRQSSSSTRPPDRHEDLVDEDQPVRRVGSAHRPGGSARRRSEPDGAGSEPAGLCQTRKSPARQNAFTEPVGSPGCRSSSSQALHQRPASFLDSNVAGQRAPAARRWLRSTTLMP